MSLKNRLIRAFANITEGMVVNIEGAKDCWAIRTSKGYGVAIKNINEFEINEKASGVRLWTDKYKIGRQEVVNCLFLTCSNEFVRKEFAALCAEFAEMGENGNNRKMITQEPIVWWEEWKSLFGNSISEKMVYDVLGELLVFEKVLNFDQNAKWSAEEYGTTDIVSSIGNFEVKSTVNRYMEKAIISSHHQLQHDNLYLVNCIFESNGADGVTIDDVLDRLSVSMRLKKHISDRIERLGYEKGSSVRKKKFTLLGMKAYKVDERFPKITAESFKGNKIPDNILKISYEISLAGIEESDILEK